MPRRRGELLTGLLRHVPAVLGVALLVGAIYVVQHEFRHLRLRDIGAALRAIPPRALVIAFAWTVLSYGVLTFYDRLGTIYAGHKVSYRRVSFASFCAYALSHNLGFAAVSGAAVRYRLYAHWGLTPFQIAKTVAFCSLTFGLGGMVLGGVVLFLEPRTIPFLGEHLPLPLLWAAGALLWAIVIGYVTLAQVLGRFKLFGHEVELPGFRMALLQVVLATVDVAITATIFYALLPPTPGLSWGVFLGIYLASYSAGLAANLPGGIGVFDTAILLGLEPYLDAPVVVGAIVVFRLYYYVIPLFLAGGLFAGNEVLLRGGALLRRAGRLQGWPELGLLAEPDFAVATSTGAVALCGVLLLILGLLAPQADFSWLDPDFADLASQAGQFVPSLIGAGLIVLAIGLSKRVNLAWGLTIVLLAGGAAFAATQPDRMWVAGVMLLTALLIAPFRACFYRHSYLFSGPLQPSTVLFLSVLTICLLSLVVTRNQVQAVADQAWWAIVLAPGTPNSLRVTVALTVVLALIAIWHLLRPGRVRFLPWDAAARTRLLMFGARPPREADGVVLGESERAAIPFRRLDRVLLGIGDPAGAESDRISAVWRLRDLARQEGLDPAFWHAGPDLLKVYADLGMTAVPLGEDGLPLPEAEDITPASERYLVCVAERDLTLLVPLLPRLAAEAEFAVPAAAE